MSDERLDEARKLIGRHFAERRKDLGLTQDQAAERAGVSVSTIKRFELGYFWIALKQLLRLCEAYELYFFVEDKEADTPLAKAMRERWRRPHDAN